MTKFNEKEGWFDLNHPRYVRAWQAAADALLKTGLPFEINTGAISRGWRSAPYPDEAILCYLREREASLLLSSDAHRRENIAFQFSRWKHLITGEYTSRK